MHIALNLAKRGLGNVYPNPSVGCVITKNEEILGRGWTMPSGRPHAEYIALQNAGDSAHGSEMYVTLEPCCHIGRGSSCVDEIIKSGVSKVCVATLDPDKRMQGAGVALLRKNGVEVIIGMMQKDAIELNYGFFLAKLKKRPMVTIKSAMTLDAKIADASGNSKWITSELSRKIGHKLRSQHDAIMIGSGTLRTDNPNLTCRLSGLNSPIRIILDSGNYLTMDHNVVSQCSKTWVVVDAIPDQKILGVEYIIISRDVDGNFKLTELMAQLVHLGITRLLVEGGAKLISSFLRQDLYDKLAVFTAPYIAGDGFIDAYSDVGVQSMSQIKRLHLEYSTRLNHDELKIYSNPQNDPMSLAI